MDEAARLNAVIEQEGKRAAEVQASLDSKQQQWDAERAELMHQLSMARSDTEAALVKCSSSEQLFAAERKSMATDLNAFLSKEEECKKDVRKWKVR